MKGQLINNLSQVLFWNVDKSCFDPEQHARFIIQRVLEYGQWQDWLVIRDCYGLNRIVSECKQLRTLDARALSYICCISNTNKEDYRCYRTAQLNPTLWNS